MGGGSGGVSRLGVSWPLWKRGTSERTFLVPNVHRTNCTIPGRTELQAGGGTGVWTAELWQKPTLGQIQVVMGEGTQGKPKSVSHNPPVLVYLLLQRSKLENLVSFSFLCGKLLSWAFVLSEFCVCALVLFFLLGKEEVANAELVSETLFSIGLCVALCNSL